MCMHVCMCMYMYVCMYVYGFVLFVYINTNWSTKCIRHIRLKGDNYFRKDVDPHEVRIT